MDWVLVPDGQVWGHSVLVRYWKRQGLEWGKLLADINKIERQESREGLGQGGQIPGTCVHCGSPQPRADTANPV